MSTYGKRKKRYLIILLLFLSCINITVGQNVRIAWEYFENERYNLAAIEFSKVIKASEERYGKDLTLARLYFFTGFSFYKEEKTDSAIIYYLKSIQTYEAIKNDTIDAWYGVCLNNLGSIRKAQGQFETAEQLFTEALSITKITEGDKSENYSIRLNNLAELYREIGYTNKAIPLYYQAIEIIENFSGKENRWYGTFLGNLAIACEEIGQFEKALALHLEALKSTELSLGKNHPDYSIRLNNTAACYRYLGQYSNAFNFYEEALKVARRTLKKDDPSIGYKLYNLASMYKKFKQYEKALTYSYEYLCDILLADIDLSKYDILESLNQIATLHIFLGQYEKADSAILMALKFFDDSNLKIDATYCALLNTIGYLQRNLNKDNEALYFYKEALQCHDLIDSSNIQGRASIINNISEIYGYLGNYEKN